MQIRLVQAPVFADRTPAPGYLVYLNDALVAVVSDLRAQPGEFAEEMPTPAFVLEAGLGPCSELYSRAPPGFRSLEEVEHWILHCFSVRGLHG